MPTKTPARTRESDKAAGLATVPAEALLFDAGPFEFAAAEGKLPVKMRARSGQPIQHWYWGRVAHDMAGFSPAAAAIPIDYCHDPTEVMGYLNTFSPSNDGLDVAGELVTLGADRSAEVSKKAVAGVPYQASIFFSPQVIEEVLPGAEAQVNGYTLPGPALVIRKWSLRGVAVCPYGYDPKTSTKLSAAGDDVPVEFLSEEPVSKQAKLTSDTPAGETPAPAAPAVDPRAEFKATLKQFSEKFGTSNGPAWAAEGLTYEQALEKHAEQLATQLKAKEDELAAAAQKLAAVPRGEETPVSFSAPDKHAAGKTVPKQFAQLGKLGAFAAGLKLPGK